MNTIQFKRTIGYFFFGLSIPMIGCGSKSDEKLSTTVTISSDIADGAKTDAITPAFQILAKLSDPSKSDQVSVEGVDVFYTTDGSTPILGGDHVVSLDAATPAVYSDDGYSFKSLAIEGITTTTTVKYLAQVRFSQKVTSKGTMSKKTSTHTFSGTSEIGTSTYTFETSPSPTPSTDPAPLAVVDSVTLTPAYTSGAYAPTAAFCFALYAKPVDSSGTVITAQSTANFTLASNLGSGTFYSNSSCSSVITSSSITEGTSSKTVFYKNSNREAITLVATYNGKAGTAYSVTLPNPYIAKIQFVTIPNNVNCQLISLNVTNSASEMMVKSPTQAMTVVSTRTSGPSTNPHFYTDSGCTTQVSESANGVSNLSVAPGQSGGTYYFNAGSAGTYFFNLNWSIGSESGVFTSSFVFLHL